MELNLKPQGDRSGFGPETIATIASSEFHAMVAQASPNARRLPTDRNTPNRHARRRPLQRRPQPPAPQPDRDLTWEASVAGGTLCA